MCRPVHESCRGFKDHRNRFTQVANALFVEMMGLKANASQPRMYDQCVLESEYRESREAEITNNMVIIEGSEVGDEYRNARLN